LYKSDIGYEDEYGFDGASFMKSFPRLDEDTENNSSGNSVAKVTLGGPRGSDYEDNCLLGSDAV
jgi:hypothetical protein